VHNGSFYLETRNKNKGWRPAYAGSCIDGRLTSLWNWASKIEKKPYYNLFKLVGFTGFDGDFQK